LLFWRLSGSRGGDFIIASQLSKPQAGQAQQYSGDLKPAWARSFEPPGVCSAVTAHNMSTLVQMYLYTKDNKYLRPIPAAIEWLENSNIAQNLWARLYEVGTNRPIYGDRMDGNKIHYDYDKLSEKERAGYAWQGEYGIGSTISYYRRCKAVGADAYQARQQKMLSRRARRQRARKAEPSVQRVIAALDDKGRWVTNDTISCQSFVRNFSILCEYLDLAQPPD